MIIKVLDSKNDAKKGIWGHIDKLFAFTLPSKEFGENETKKKEFRS